MLRVKYPQIVIDKAKAIYDEYKHLKCKDRRLYTVKRVNLSPFYLEQIGTKMQHPSDRTLMNLGFTLLIRDNATGEIQEMEYSIKCDPRAESPNPNQGSTKVFVGGSEAHTILSELNLPTSPDSPTYTSYREKKNGRARSNSSSSESES